MSRTLKGSATGAPDQTKVQELVLDGQQRLTSLWNALRGTAPGCKFYIEVKNLKNRNMEVKQIIPYLDRSANGHAVRNPEIAFHRNIVPLDILYDEQGNGSANEDSADEPGKIWDWCENACQDGDGAARRIENAIRRSSGTTTPRAETPILRPPGRYRPDRGYRHLRRDEQIVPHDQKVRHRRRHRARSP